MPILGLVYVIGFCVVTLGGSALFARKILVDYDRATWAESQALARKRRILLKHVDEVVVLRRTIAEKGRLVHLHRVDEGENLLILSAPGIRDGDAEPMDFFAEQLDSDLEVFDEEDNWLTDPNNPEGENS